MFHLDLDYLLLNLLMLFSFIISGKLITERKYGYWRYAFCSILIFVFVFGSRFLRGNDYDHYVDIYIFGFAQNQPAFIWFNDFLRERGVGPHFIFYYYALVFIICAVVYLRLWRNQAIFLYPLFLIANVVFEEYEIRQSLSFSFVFLYILFVYHFTQIRSKVKHLKRKKNSINALSFQQLLDKEFYKGLIVNTKYKQYFYVLFAIAAAYISYSIHNANIIVIILFTLFYFIYNKTIPLFISIPLLVLCTYFFADLFNFDYLVNYFENLETENERLEEYTNRSEKWFGREGFNAVFIRNPIVQIAELMGNISLFYLGARVIKERLWNRLNCSLYNLYVIGICVKKAFLQLEIMNRMGGVFYNFWCLPLALVLYYYNSMRWKYWEKFLSLFLLFFIYDYLKYLLMRGESTLFLWDIIK